MVAFINALWQCTSVCFKTVNIYEKGGFDSSRCNPPKKVCFWHTVNNQEMLWHPLHFINLCLYNLIFFFFYFLCRYYWSSSCGKPQPLRHIGHTSSVLSTLQRVSEFWRENGKCSQGSSHVLEPVWKANTMCKCLCRKIIRLHLVSIWERQTEGERDYQIQSLEREREGVEHFQRYSWEEKDL